MTFTEFLLVGVLVWFVISEQLHRRERERLEAKLMSRTFQEYNYFTRQYPKELRIAEKARTKEVKAAFSGESNEEYERKKKFVAGLEEDWSPDEIDEKRLSEMNNEPEIGREDYS